MFDEERKRSFAELLGGKEHRVEEVRMPDTDGIEHWLRVTVDPVEDASGRVAHTVGKIEVIDEERREKDQLVARAERDSLTGLLNSETTRLRIGQQLDALAGGERGALLVVDVDCFKDVNDTHGHLVGDLVLADIARILRENFRIGDVVGRLGGDEFMVYLDRVGSTDVVLGKCDRLRRAVERHEYPGTDCRVTISVGVVLAHAGDTFDDLYGRADEALYAAGARRPQPVRPCRRCFAVAESGARSVTSAYTRGLYSAKVHPSVRRICVSAMEASAFATRTKRAMGIMGGREEIVRPREIRKERV